VAKVQVLVEVIRPVPEAFTRFAAAGTSPREAVTQSESVVSKLGDLGLEVVTEAPPIPLFAETERAAFAAFASAETSPDHRATSTVVACEIDSSKVNELAGRPHVKVWPNSRMEPFPRKRCRCGGQAAIGETIHLDESRAHPFDLARSAATQTDCRPFRPAVTLDIIRTLLAVEAVWRDGFRGQNIVVGLIDEGVSDFYPVIGGHERPGGSRPGTASIQSHGSMCAADVLVAAPFAKLYDYPFLAGQDAGSSGVALEMFQAILDQRRVNGTPHLTSNSYGFYSLPSRDEEPNHEAYDPDHPLNRKVREVIASGAACFFAAGNCGEECPAGNCHSSAIGPKRSISGANSLPETLAIAAVNSRHERIGYSAQGPGTLAAQKPDLSAYSHFFGNFGPGRPAGGTEKNFDNGTSAACPVAAGVAALLLSAFADLSPDDIRLALTETAIDLGPPGWDANTGAGVVNAGAAYTWLQRRGEEGSEEAVPVPRPRSSKRPSRGGRGTT
jgi:subtilisin family serine protease